MPKSPTPVRAMKRKVYSHGGFTTTKDGIFTTSELVVDSLERGVIVNLHANRKKSERMSLCLWSNLGQLVFLRSVSSNAFITVNLDEVKEISKNSRQRLSRSYEDARDIQDPTITIYYGMEFTLNTVSFSIQSSQGMDLDQVFLALQVATGKCNSENYYEQRERWFHKEFDQLRSFVVASQKSKENKISLRHVKAWLFRKHSYDVSPQLLTLTQNKLSLSEYLDVESFSILLTDLLSTNLVVQLMKKYGTASSDGKSYLTLESFNKFLVIEQKETKILFGTDIDRMKTCFPPDHKSESSLVFSQRQFENFLFSDANTILNPIEERVHQDMDKSLCHYWIASSHNTYLTAGQWKGESSVEAYARCLWMGCRCLELDCWDGPDCKPIITHGRSLTSRIRVADVLHTIKEHAWSATDYPLILSIENHCCLAQQRVLATLLKEIFQDDLLTEPVDPDETCLPSPNQLRRKVIIKNKKLQTDGKVVDARVDGMDSMNIKKCGTLSLKYANEKVWHPFKFGLGESHVCFSPFQEVEEDIVEEQSVKDYFEGYESDDESTEDEVALNSQLWYHGALSREEAEKLLQMHRHRGDGTFLVRDSNKGGYALSFLCQQNVSHSLIKVREDKFGKNEFLVGNETWHKNIPELVQFYKAHKLSFRSNAMSIHLTFPVCKEFEFFNESWYRRFSDRAMVEETLKKTSGNGAFVVRSSSIENSFSLSFKTNRNISHFQIKYINKKFVLSNYRFSTMESLVSYFQRHPLYQTVKLSVAASESIEEEHFDDTVQVDSELYACPEETKMVMVRALYDFQASTQDELSFKRGSYITNVVVEDRPWWRGDHGGEFQKRFPASYVKEIEEDVEGDGAGKPSEAALHLANCHIESNIQCKDGTHYFLLTHSCQPSTLLVGSNNYNELKDWLNCLLDTMDKLNNQAQELQKQERSKKIAQELSDIVVYCQCVPYDPARKGKFCEMSSLSEEKVGKDDQTLLLYQLTQLIRVYPNLWRVSSTNYDPMPKFNMGCQMLALNYQTPDRSMQINQARFLQNGRCGFVLKPDFMQTTSYNPSKFKPASKKDSVFLTVKVLGGRNLGAGGSGVTVGQPFVVVEVIGLPLDNQKERTQPKSQTSLNPVWKQDVFEFQICCPQLAFLRFEVCSENNDSCLSQATLPIPSILQGYRSVQLKNMFSEKLPISTLLVHIEINCLKEDEETQLFLMMLETRRQYNELSSSTNVQDKREQLLQAEKNLLEYLSQIKKHWYSHSLSLPLYYWNELKPIS